MKYSHFSSVLFTFLLSIIFINTAYAQELNDVAASITESVRLIPAGIAGLAYLSGVLMALWGVTKTIDHVTNPTQTPIRMPLVRFLIGGALFSLPIIIEAAHTTISGGVTPVTGPLDDMLAFGGFMNAISGNVIINGNNFNAIIESAIDATDLLPSLISAISYLLGLLLCVSALYKVRDHIDDPTRVTLKEPVIRIITAGALFATPTIFAAMFETLTNGLGFANINGIFNTSYFLHSTETTTDTCTASSGGFAGSLGEVLCNSVFNSMAFPAFFTALSYILGLAMGVWGIMKLRDHALNPTQTPLWDGLSRFLAGGAFFALPAMVYVMKTSLLPAVLAGESTENAAITNTTFNENVACSATGNSLDQAMACFMQNMLGPSHILVNFFCFVAGVIFIMIGISRLVRSAQEGPKGPGGIGTLTTFIIGGFLLSATTILRSLSTSFFGNTDTLTYATLAYTTGMSTAETDAVYNVISAVLKFMIILGIISFVRGLFIIRDVAEGNQQASTMAAVTHIVGGALAVNLGPLLNAIQTTLGITGFGLTFGGTP